MKLSFRLGGTVDEWRERTGGTLISIAVYACARRAHEFPTIAEGEPIEYVRTYQTEYFVLDVRRGGRRYAVRIYRYAREIDCGPSIRFWWGKRKWPRRVLWGKPPIITPAGAELRDRLIERHFNPRVVPPAPPATVVFDRRREFRNDAIHHADAPCPTLNMRDEPCNLGLGHDGDHDFR